MSRARFHAPVEPFSFEELPAEKDNLASFSVRIKPFNPHSTALQHISKFQKEPINGVTINFTADEREVKITITPSPTVEFSACDKEFRTAIAKLKNNSNLTSHDGDKIITAYQNYLKRNNIASDLSVKLSTSFVFDRASDGSVH